MINPLELLRLNYHELERITPELIERAQAQLLEEAGGEGIDFKGQRLSAAEVAALAQGLQAPAELAFYYRLSQYPQLSSWLAGDSGAVPEPAALRDSSFRERLAPLLAPAFAQQVQQALAEGKGEGLQTLGQQLASSGDADFQSWVFQDAADLLTSKREDLQILAQTLGDHPTEEALQPLRGLRLLREACPAGVLNALPDFFQPARETLALEMSHIAVAILDSDSALALGVARYARQLNISNSGTQQLDAIIAQLQQATAYLQKTAATSRNRRWYIRLGLYLAGLLIVALGLGLYLGLITPPWASDKDLGWADLDELEEEGISTDKMARLKELFEEKGSLTREELDDFMQQGGGGAPVVMYDALQLPWRERGKATETPLSGEVELGSAPMAACFPPALELSGKRQQQLTILGDEYYDALVFFFNGRNYIRQAFLPAKSQYILQGKMDEQQVISTMIIFGKNWDPALESPCGTPGYFAESIHYAGFAGYAIDPVYPDLRSDLVAKLKKSRLLPARELKEQEFFDLLEKYR